MSFISLSKRFKQKSNLLRLNLFLSTISEFHFHGIKCTRFLKIPKAFFTNQYAVIDHLGFWSSIRAVLWIRLYFEFFINIKQTLFSFPLNIYSFGLAASVSKFQPKIFDELDMRFRVPIGIYAFTTDLQQRVGQSQEYQM